MINHTDAVYTNNETRLSWPIISSSVCDESNHVIGRRGAMCAENYIKISWPIKLAIIYDENQIGQWHDQSYKCGLRKKMILNYSD